MFIGGVIGRATAPTKEFKQEKTAEKQIEAAANKKEDTSVETKTADIRGETRWKIRYVARPDGTVVASASGDSGQSTKRTSHREEAKRDVEIRYVDREKATEKIVIKETSKPNWALTAGAGVRSGYAAVYQGGIDRRVFGPFRLYATADKETGAPVRFEAGATVRFEW